MHVGLFVLFWGFLCCFVLYSQYCCPTDHSTHENAKSHTKKLPICILQISSDGKGKRKKKEGQRGESTREKTKKRRKTTQLPRV